MSSVVIRAPELKPTIVKLFLAGGISNCPEWQTEAIKRLTMRDHPGVCLWIFDPRRENWGNLGTSAIAQQIRWEHLSLMESDIVLFWFPKETLCPITLFELGKMSMTARKLFVGCDPEYKRLLDVKEQLGLIRPEIKVHYSLFLLVNSVIDYIAGASGKNTKI